MEFWAYIAALVAYAGAAAVLLRALAAGDRTAPRAGAVAGGVGVAAHLAASVGYTAAHGELPLVGLGPSLATFSLLVALWATPLLWLREARPLGVVLMPLAAALLGGGLLVGVEPAPAELAFRGAWFYLHVLLTFVGYVCFAGAFAAGLLYLIQHRELKGKHFGRWFRFLPPLESLERWQRRALEVGLPALTLGLLVGWAWTTRFARPLPAWHPKIVWGLLSWVLLALALLAHLAPTRHRRGALVSVVGFAVTVAVYVVLRLSESQGSLFL